MRLCLKWNFEFSQYPNALKNLNTRGDHELKSLEEICNSGEVDKIYYWLQLEMHCFFFVPFLFCFSRFNMFANTFKLFFQLDSNETLLYVLLIFGVSVYEKSDE